MGRSGSSWRLKLLVVVDASIVTLALSAIGRALHFPAGNLQWVISAYALVFGGFLLLGGRAADLLGRRRILIAGVSVFTVASLACGLAASAGTLIAARAAEGLGAAMMAPAALSLILIIFAEGPGRNKALGLFGAVADADAALGVLSGGMLTTWLSPRRSIHRHASAVTATGARVPIDHRRAAENQPPGNRLHPSLDAAISGDFAYNENTRSVTEQPNGGRSRMS